MEPQCTFEHRRCVNSGFDDWPVIELVKQTRAFVKSVNHLTIVYAAKGAVLASFGTVRDYPIGEGNMMLFPPGTTISCSIVKKPATLLMLKVKHRVQLCDKYVFGGSIVNLVSAPLEHSHLEAVPQIKRYMEQIMDDVVGRVACFKLMEIKVLEFFYYLKAFYRPMELACFIQPLFSTNSQFMYFIWNNYRNVRSVKEFALLASCSLSAFKIKFKSVTGMSPSQWMTEQKSRNVFHEISRGEKSLKEISEEYHFSSVSHLGTFCRKNFGVSPGALKPKIKKTQ